MIIDALIKFNFKVGYLNYSSYWGPLAFNSLNFYEKHHSIYHDKLGLFIIGDILSLKKESLRFVMDISYFLVKLVMNFCLINCFHLLKTHQPKLCLYDSLLHLDFQLCFFLAIKALNN